VTQPSTDSWIYNLYPDGGAAIINFTESNQPKLFGVV
jgi:hypothetical protein